MDRLDNVGGPTYTVPTLCRHLSAIGERVRLHVVEPRPVDALADVDVEFYARSGWSSALDGSPQMLRGLRRVARSADVIHVHQLWRMPTVYPGWAARGTGCRLVWSPRGTLDPWAFAHRRWRKRLFWHAMQRESLEAVHCIHVTAKQEYEFVRDHGFRAPVALIPNGVDVPNLPPPAPRTNGKRRVLYLARIHPKKGVANLLRAWSRVESRFTDWELRIVGPDNDGHLAEMRDLARALDLRSADLVGFVPESQKSAEYRQADLYVLPTFNENWGVTIADALSHAVPAIVGRGAPWQGLEGHDCGWWIDNSPASLVRCFESALTKPRDELHAMGLRGRQWMAAEFAWPRAADQMRRVYRWLVDGGVPPNTVLAD